MCKRSVQRKRTCLRCGEYFVSMSSANRICQRCKKTSYGVYAEAMRLEDEEREKLRPVGVARLTR